MGLRRWECRLLRRLWFFSRRSCWRTWPWRQRAGWGVFPCREPWSNRPWRSQWRGPDKIRLPYPLRSRTAFWSLQRRGSRACRYWQWVWSLSFYFLWILSCPSYRSNRDGICPSGFCGDAGHRRYLYRWRAFCACPHVRARATRALSSFWSSS